MQVDRGGYLVFVTSIALDAGPPPPAPAAAIERCDAKRVELCAHRALMNACPDRVAACETGIIGCEAVGIGR